MTWKKVFVHGLISGVLAALSAIIYGQIYQQALGTDFGKVVNVRSIAGACLFGCLSMAIGLGLLEKSGKLKFSGLYYLILSLLSFLSILGPLSVTLPLDLGRPELFPGLTVPMHFLPVIAFFSIAPFFRYVAIPRPHTNP